jgi:hypothetical protein
MFPRYLVPVAAVLSLAAPASAAGPQWAVSPNACVVMNDATAKALLGPSAHLLRKAQLNPQMSQCQYGSDNGIVTLVVGDWRMIHTANPTEKKVPGLGDEAFTSAAGVYVRKGMVGMSVNVIVQNGSFWGTAADNALAEMAAAAHKAAAALLPRL